MGNYLIQPITQINSQADLSAQTKLKYSLCQMQGWRRQMEDSTICENNLGDGNALYGVFDGHGGKEVSKFVSKYLLSILNSLQNYKQGNYVLALTEAFRKMDKLICSAEGQIQLKKIQRQYYKKQKSNISEKICQGAGCTANVVLITPTSYIVANIGDSRSALLRKDYQTVVLSNDHKPEVKSEYERILNAGGEIKDGRVNGGLNLTRSFGDFVYKSQTKLEVDQQLIISEPDVQVFKRQPTDDFILMGCDGIWQKYLHNSHQLMIKVKKEKDQKKEGIEILKQMFNCMIAKDLHQETGCDNMTAILIQFL